MGTLLDTIATGLKSANPIMGVRDHARFFTTNNFELGPANFPSKQALIKAIEPVPLKIEINSRRNKGILRNRTS